RTDDEPGVLLSKRQLCQHKCRRTLCAQRARNCSILALCARHFAAADRRCQSETAISHRSNRMNTPNPVDLLFAGMDKLSPGDDSLSLVVFASLPQHCFEFVFDAGFGAGRQTMVLASELGTSIQAVDFYQPFFNRL